MIEPGERLRFQSVTDTGVPAAAIAALSARVRADGDGASQAARTLAAALAHAAFVAPERTAAIYDDAAGGWYGRPVNGMLIDATARASGADPLPPAFWDRFWALVEDTGSGMGAAEVTLRTAALGGVLPPLFSRRIATACAAYPGVAQAAAMGPPGRFRLEDLAACPAGSLGHAFYRLIVDNAFDLEVLDRDALDLERLPAPLPYLNARILQVHDLWHLVAGYRTTGLHEIGISAFQLAQFGHGYSAMFLAMVVGSASLKQSPAAPVLWETIFSAWVHGRQCPPLIGAPWESLWSRSIEDVRRQLGVSAYASPFPPDIFEQAAAASFQH